MLFRSQLIYIAFAGGWQYFAFSIMKDKDNVGVISKVFEILAIISFIITLLVTSLSKLGIEMLFTEEYWGAYISVPYLFFSPLLLMLFQIGTNQFLVIKKTWPNLIILSAGAVLNIALNLILIPIIGIEGASIATLVGYVVSIVLCVIVLLRMKLLTISFRFLLSLIAFMIIFAVMRINSFALLWLNISLVCAYILFIIILYFKNIKSLLNKIKNKSKNKKNVVSEKDSNNLTEVDENTVEISIETDIAFEDEIPTESATNLNVETQAHTMNDSIIIESNAETVNEQITNKQSIQKTKEDLE